MSTKTPLILVINDDGISAPGIAALVEVAKSLGRVVVVAPDKPQSGVGHAITINATLRIKESKIFGEEVKAYSCSGTPVDCVKMAMDVVLDEKPDIVVSGINHGSNSSINVIYSGTMSAAMEGAIEGMRSIGFSLLDHAHEADFTACKHFAGKIIRKSLDNPIPERVCLNVNMPRLSVDEIMGIKVCRQAVAYWKEKFEERKDPNGNSYYWLTGEFINDDDGDDTDEYALAQNYVSVVPVQCDLTAYNTLREIKDWDL